MKGTIMLATGGTGGHVFPATALAEKLQARGWSIVYLTDSRGESYLPPESRRYIINSASPHGNILQQLRGLFRLASGTLQSFWHMLTKRPKALVGFGSYAMVPPLIAGLLTGIKIILHEQNAVLGRANNAGTRMARVLALSHDIREELSTEMRDMLVVTGNPVRAQFEKTTPYEVPGQSGPIQLVVLGGSQGASIFSEVIPDAVASLPDDLQKRLLISHQCRKEDIAKVQELYGATVAEVETAAFFNDPWSLLTQAQLVISRAGATVIAELKALGRPAILVPFKRALDQDQLKNAENVAARGGGVLLTEDMFTSASLAEILTTLFKDTRRLELMAEKSYAIGERDAANRLADVVEAVIYNKELVR